MQYDTPYRLFCFSLILSKGHCLGSGFQLLVVNFWIRYNPFIQRWMGAFRDFGSETDFVTKSMANPPHKEASPPHKEANPPHKEHAAPDLLDEDTCAQFRVLAKPVAEAKRASKTAMEGAILAICQDQYIRPQLLASLLNRDLAGLQYRYLAPLIKRGLLERKYPENPSHPEQAYRTSHRKVQGNMD